MLGYEPNLVDSCIQRLQHEAGQLKTRQECSDYGQMERLCPSLGGNIDWLFPVVLPCRNERSGNPDFQVKLPHV